MMGVVPLRSVKRKGGRTWMMGRRGVWGKRRRKRINY
jgi:hypothetical protein